MNKIEEKLLILPESWTWGTIYNIASLISGQHILKENYNLDALGIPYLTGPDDFGLKCPTISKWTEIPKAMAVQNDVLITVKGAGVGKVNVLDITRAAISRQLMAIRSENVNSIYLYYYFKFIFSYLQKLGAGSTVPGIDRESILALPVPIAPIHEQRRIVAKIDELFSRLDAGVEALQKAMAQLKRYRQAVLKAAIEGRLTEEWRKAHSEVEPAKTPLEQVEGLELPHSWKFVTLKSICIDITDGDHQAPPQSLVGIPFLVISNIRKGELDFSKTRFVPEEYYESIPTKRKPSKGDILYSLVGSYGIPIIVNTKREFCFQRHIGLIRPSDVVDTDYLFYFLKSNFAFRQATDAATGTAQLTVPLQGLRNFKVPFPPLAEQKTIVSEIERIFSHSESIESTCEINLSQADRMRQSILKRAFEGKLVPQDNSDEPASVLLERIKAGRIKDSPRRGRKSNNVHQMRLIQ